MYIGQSVHFPLERAVSEGGVALSQEPCVEYVALTRATHELFFLQDVNLEASSMEAIYFEL